ncbi:MAG: hypothetical protein QME96_16620, partial [Myxococcota bacterium]|nr:hypothetical protein [Myxococcota bacterium]
RAVRAGPAAWSTLPLRLILVDKPSPEWADAWAEMNQAFGVVQLLHVGPAAWIAAVVRRRVGEHLLDEELLGRIAAYSGGLVSDALLLAHRVLRRAGGRRVMTDDLRGVLDQQAALLALGVGAEDRQRLEGIRGGGAGPADAAPYLLRNLAIQVGAAPLRYVVHPLVERALGWGDHAV